MANVLRQQPLSKDQHSSDSSSSSSSSSPPAGKQPTFPTKLKKRGEATSDQPSSDNGVRAKTSSGQSNLVKASRTHNELHKELLLAHKRGLALSSRSELQQVLERRKRVQSDQEEEGHNRTPLEDMLLRRQQKQLEGEKDQKVKVQEEAQLMEFVRVRQNLRKIHSAIQNKSGTS